MKSLCALVPVLLLAACGTNDPSNPNISLSEAELSSNTHTAFNYFVAKGLTKRQSAGIVGNLMQESSVDPRAIEFGGGPGRGIAQWSVGGRWDTSKDDNVTWYANRHNVSRWSLRTQLHFTWYELADVGGYGLSALRNATTIKGATLDFERDFEKCGQCDEAKRIAYAHEVYDAFAASAARPCFSETLGAEVPHGACLQSADGVETIACDDGDWVDGDTAPSECTDVQMVQ